MTDSKNLPSPSQMEKQAKKEKLAAALRANLRRRKAAPKPEVQKSV